MSKIVDEIKKIIKAEIETDGQGDFWSFGRGPQKVSDFIESKKESITINDIDKILKYFCSDSLCPAYFTHIILKNRKYIMKKILRVRIGPNE